MSRAAPLACSALAVATLVCGRARAEDVTFEAGRLDADLNRGSVVLSDHVRVRFGRYRFFGEELRLRATPLARPDELVVTGQGRVALCPCEDPPVALAFTSARALAAGDLIVRSPRLELFGHTVLWLPWLWVRAPSQVGLLPPIVAWRGDDGLLLGAGLHLPLPEHGALDLRGGGYTAGGAHADVRLRTARTLTVLTWDEVRGRSVGADSRGSIAGDADKTFAWSVDALRGDRARSATIDLGPAAMAYDAASLGASLRLPLARATGAQVGAGLVATAPRGEGAIALGPSAFVGASGVISRAVVWRGDASSSTLAQPARSGALTLARAGLSADAHAALGPLDARLGVGAGARVAVPPLGATAIDSAAFTRAELGVPLARRFGRWTHLIEPRVEGEIALTQERGSFWDGLRAPAPAIPWHMAAGVDSRLVGLDDVALDAALRVGWLGADAAGSPIARANLELDTRYIAATLQSAVVGFERSSFDNTMTSTTRGFIADAELRLGSSKTPRLRMDAIAQTGGGAAPAMRLAADDIGTLITDRVALLARPGLMGSARLEIPWPAHITSNISIYADILNSSIISEAGSLQYAHPCGCLGLGLYAAHRLGRRGADVWATVDLTP